ncbi:uncharacterized protein METZ01_LOCUS193230 [marine metagenome]|uniref:Uncharacterized protein n=1 Tax=marine metagenome TaxID=408172 RepID=A0A382DPI4_9ZZZZ
MSVTATSSTMRSVVTLAGSPLFSCTVGQVVDVRRRIAVFGTPMFTGLFFLTSVVAAAAGLTPV